MNKKYEFVPGDEIVIAPGRTVKRIRALVAIAALGIAPGDTGGYIESEKNLSQVYGNAWVFGDARVFGDALVFGDARVYGDAWVYGDAQVYGNAQVFGDARVYGNADWLLIGPAKSSGRFTTAYKDEKLGVRVTCGCFSGSVLDFSKQIESTHKNNLEALQQYRLFCQLIAFNFGLEP